MTEFAKEIYNIPLEERFEKLYEKVFQEMFDREAGINDVMMMGNILKKLEG